MLRYLRTLCVEVFDEAEKTTPARGSTFKAAAVCITAALCLTLAFYLGTPAMMRTLTEAGDGWMQKLWWAGAVIVFYLLVPMLVVKYGLRERLSDFGLVMKFPAKDLLLYLGMFGLVLMLVALFSGTVAFQARYPFYKPTAGESLWPRFWIWEAVYLLQFVAVEFFFRGFLLHGLRRRIGFMAVFVSMMPYCLVHFGKPLPETLGAIIAGIVLGIFSLKSRSILPGVLLHGGVALGMDLAVLWRLASY
ncbi:MAG: CPBP family intramembrane glutamic endopeptidase [Verrucomicrobiaceae bacterium]